MHKYMGHKLTQVATCLLCAVFAWNYEHIVAPLEGTEFGGGWLTGPLLHLYDLGALLFFLTLFLVFFFPRTTAVITILASLACLPLYLYFMAPGPYRRIFYWVDFGSTLRSDFRWNAPAVEGILILVLSSYVAVCSLLVSKQRKSKSPV